MERLQYPKQEFFRIPQEAKVEENWGRADLHLHSRDALGDIPIVLKSAREKGLDLVAITEHDNNENFQFIWKLGQDMGVQVVAGVEITVLAPNLAHLLIYFPDPDCLPSSKVYENYFARGTDARRAIEGIHEMGGFCIVPHPTSPLTFSFGRNYLRQLQDGSGNFFLDGIEVLNSTLAGWSALPNIEILFREGRLGGAVGGSDARLPEHVGFCQTRFPGKTAEEFIKALRESRTVAEGNFYSLGDHLSIAHRQAKTVINRAQEFLERSLYGHET